MKRLLNLILVATISLFSLIFITAQTPAENPRNVRKERTKNQYFDDWLKKDVPYIITPAEKKVFEELKTPEEKENFIALFWQRRDPDPDTEENEYREEYYERIQYANEKFTSGKPGWMTDRGRIYITFGKPDSVESHPSGGSYDRPSYEGGGSTTTYPFEIWFYRHLDNIGDGLEIEFVDPTGTGEYRLARNPNEKDALLMVPGAGQTLAEQLGLETRADRISGFSKNYVAGKGPFDRLQIEQGLFTPPQPKDVDLGYIANTGGGIVDNTNAIEFDLQVNFFRQSDQRVIAAFTVQADNEELTFVDQGGLQTARMNIFGRVMAVSGKRSGIFEDSVATSTTAEELAQLKERKSIYQKAIALAPGGTYKVIVAVRDIVTGKVGRREIGFTVPTFDENKLSASTLILASRLYQTTEKNLGESFIIGDKKVIPNLSAKYRKGQEVGIYLQIYNAGIDQTTLKPAAEVKYVLLRDGKEIHHQVEDWSGLSDSGQRLTLARLLPTANLEKGEYELRIKIRDQVNNQSIEPRAKFTIED